MFKFNTFLERPLFKLNGIQLGKGIKLIGWPFIFRFPGSEIKIGNGCIIRSNFWSNLIGLYQRTIIIAKKGGKCRHFRSELHPIKQFLPITTGAVLT